MYLAVGVPSFFSDFSGKALKRYHGLSENSSFPRRNRVHPENSKSKRASTASFLTAPSYFSRKVVGHTQNINIISK